MRGEIQKPLLARLCPGMVSTVLPGKPSRRLQVNAKSRNGQREIRGQRTDGSNYWISNSRTGNRRMMKWSLRYSKFLVRHSAVQREGSSDKLNLDSFSPEFWILTPGSLLYAQCPMPFQIRNPHSAFRIPHSAFRNCQSALRPSLIPATSSHPRVRSQLIWIIVS